MNNNRTYATLLIGMLFAMPLYLAGDELYAWTVGTTSEGQRIQQVEWTFADKELITTNFPVWAGSILEIVEEIEFVTKIKCSISNIPNRQAWGLTNIHNGYVEGWIQTKKLVQVKMADLKKSQ